MRANAGECGRGPILGFVDVVAFRAANVAAEPSRNRKLTEAIASEDAQFRFEHRCHHEHQNKPGERNEKVDCETTDGDCQPDDETESDKRGASP